MIGEVRPLSKATRASSTQRTLRGYAAIGNQWWSEDPDQRFWMELVNVDTWGSILVAPELPRHALMYDVKPGDIVFHWVGKNNPRRLRSGMYGYSTVAGELAIGAGEWLDEPANTVPLTDYHDLDQPLYLESLREYSTEIFSILEELKSSTKQTAHFPFQEHPTAGLKPNQRYLSKFPARMLEIVPELRPDSDWGGMEDPVIIPPLDASIPEFRRRYSGYCADPVLRKALETAAVQQATEHYEGQGYVVTDVGLTHSFDLIAQRGNEVRHIAVKGSQGPMEKVQLTRNEVDHANVYALTDLVIVREIDWSRESEDEYVTTPGQMDIMTKWRPTPENLKPISYEYFLD